MNKLIYVGVFALGGVTGYLVAKRRLENKYNQLVQEEIDSVKANFASRADRETQDVLRTQPTEILDEDENFRHIVNPLVRSSIEKNPYEQVKTRYDINKPVRTGSDDDTCSDDEDDINPEPELIDIAQPYIISDVEFCEECDSYDKIALFYHSDGVLCSEDEEIIDDIDRTIGQTAFHELVYSKDARPCVWVRNNAISADYEIIGINTPYSDMIDPPTTTSMKRRKPHEDNDLS